MKHLMLFTLLIGSLSVSASGIVCSEDGRPRDASYSEIKLEKVGSTYQMSSTIITAGFGAPVQTTTNVIAKDLKCQVKGLLAYCARWSNGTSDEVSIQQVKRTALDTLTNPIPREQDLIEIKISSSEKPAAETFEFDLNDRFTSCLEIQ